MFALPQDMAFGIIMIIMYKNRMIIRITWKWLLSGIVTLVSMNKFLCPFFWPFYFSWGVEAREKNNKYGTTTEAEDGKKVKENNKDSTTISTQLSSTFMACSLLLSCGGVYLFVFENGKRRRKLCWCNFDKIMTLKPAIPAKKI